MTEWLRVTYELRPAAGEDPEAKARDVAVEQTAELPEAVLSEAIRTSWVGRVGAVTGPMAGIYRATIDYPLAAAGDDFAQLLNLLFGNSSLKDGIRLVDIAWPRDMPDWLRGPGLGIDGLRALLGVPSRALLAAVLKPMGSPAEALAASAAAFARAGVDIIKDDHGLTNQSAAPFEERMSACQQAVSRANAERGGRSLYFPNVTAAWPVLAKRAQAARAAGCQGVLVNLAITGLDTAAWLRDELGLAVMAHPSLTGGLFREHHGIAPEVILGDLFRLAGADAVIYPNVGGRFGFSAALCQRLNARLRGPLGTSKAALPTPGGGVDAKAVPGWVQRYGADTIFLIGGSLYRHENPASAAGELLEAMRR